MNKLIIYIEVHKERPLNFENIVLGCLRNVRSNDVVLDLDNFSGSDMFNHVLEAAKDSLGIILIINQKDVGASLGMVLNLINKLLRQKQLKVDSYLLGENKMLEKMLSKMRTLRIMKEEEFVLLVNTENLA